MLPNIFLQIIENKYGFTEVLKHVNDMAHRIDLQRCVLGILYQDRRGLYPIPGEVCTVYSMY